MPEHVDVYNSQQHDRQQDKAMAKGYAHQQSLEKIYGKTSNVFLSRQSKSSSKLFATPTTAAATGNLMRESGDKMKDNMKASERNLTQVSLKNQQADKTGGAGTKAMTDSEIAVTLAKVANLQKFKEMVLMNLKKSDMPTQVLVNQRSDEVVLPVNSFKQCLKVIGVNIGQAQLQRFAIRGDVEGYESGQARSQYGGSSASQRMGNEGSNPTRQISSSAAAVRPQIRAFIAEDGPRQLGINVKEFLKFYI